MAVLGGRFLERRDPILVELRRPPEPWRSRVDLYGFRPHRLGALKRKVQPAGRIDVSSKNRHSRESNSGPIWHADRALSVFVMGDLDLAVRGRTYREPDGPHSMVVRGRDLDSALQHVTARSDCRSVAVVGLPEQVPDMTPLIGKRLLLVDGDSGRLREFAEVAIRAGIEVEWIRSARPPFERLVGSRTVATLLRAWRREGSRPAVAASSADGWAPPVILSRELWGDLFALKGDAGARQVLQGRSELIDIVPAPGRSDDIDTPDDYTKIVKLFPRRRPRQRA